MSTLMLSRDGAAPIVRREDYAAPDYTIREAALTFDLDPTETVVSSHLVIARDPARPRAPLRLHAEELRVDEVRVDGAPVAFRHEAGAVVLDAPAAEVFVVEVRNAIAPEKNTQLSGLYASGSGLFTQCEAEGFRRITCFLDRPDVMATFTVTLRGDRARYPVLLSNGNLVDEGALPDGRHFAVWHDPFPKPSYLFALVAGDLARVERRVVSRAGRGHLLQIYVQRKDLDKTEHAMRALVASIAWDESRFGLALDLERFMIVAVDDFNMGAMENKGLNIFNARFVLAAPATATDDDFDNVERVVAHEYLHNWTGNRVTCRDWFQLSLKEGLTVFRDQEFSADLSGGESARAVRRIADVRALRERQFPEDAGAMAHPVRPDAYQAIDNFYTATVYEKGAEVVRMMHTLVGREGFAAGMTLYFSRHDGQAVTCDDFLAAIADANPDSPLARHRAVFARWYDQAGTPRLTARGHWDAAARTYTLSLRQHTPATPGQTHKQPLVVPVRLGLLGRDGGSLPLRLQGEDAAAGSERVLVLTEEEASWVFVGVDREVVPSLLRGFSAPVILDDGLGDDDLLTLLAHDPDAFNRWEAGQRLAVNRLLQAVRDDGVVRLDETYLDALRRVLDDPALDPSFKALALQPPAEAFLAEMVTPVDPQRIHAACASWRSQVAAHLHDGWTAALDAHDAAAPYRPDVTQRGRRALTNLALAMRVRHAADVGDPRGAELASRRFDEATNLTDALGALEALVNTRAPQADAALARFLEALPGEALVVDKWFEVQARAHERDGEVFARVRQLQAHPLFSLTNPNRVRALLGSFVRLNPAAFHRADGAGYALWADGVIALDATNPQLASRLARAMDRWSVLAEPFRAAARAAIHRVAECSTLSGDVREVVTRALAVG
jgi:aminopeptidase N